MKIKKIFLYETTHLPEEGWFQGCIRCETITANIKLFKTITTTKKITEVRVYLCLPCQNVLKDNTLDKIFIENCELILEEYGTYKPVDPKPPDPRVVSSN